MSRVTQTSGTVTSATGSTSSSTYAYDASSNLTILPSGATATYDQSGELVSSNLPAISGQPQISTTYSYNANGDRIRSQISQNSGTHVTETSATWNAANELMTYTSPSEAMTNATYNGLGLRTSATFTTTSPSTGQTNTSTENYLYDSTGSLPSLIMDSGHAYLYSNSISPYEQVNLITGKVTYLITGANGSVRGVMTQNYDLKMIAEVKTGTQSASQRIRGQICKDVYILNNYNNKNINPRPGEGSKKNETPVTNDAWIFLPNQSGVTNPSGPLLQALSAANIPTCVVYYGDFPLGSLGELNSGYAYAYNPGTVPDWLDKVIHTGVVAGAAGASIGSIIWGVIVGIGEDTQKVGDLGFG